MERCKAATPGQGGLSLDNAVEWLSRVSDHGNRSPGWNAIGYLLGTVYGVGVLMGAILGGLVGKVLAPPEQAEP